MTDFNALPKGCISKIISFTAPLDACVVSLVSKLFKSAADSDVTWEKLLSLPLYYSSILSLHIPNMSKKELYLTLNYPILIEDGKKSISLEKKTGNISVMLGARDLSLMTSEEWDWISVPDSRFLENAKLNVSNQLEIHGLISTKALSPQTLYAAYFVFKLEPQAYGFKNQSIDVAFEPVGRQGIRRAVCLNPIAEIQWGSSDYMYLVVRKIEAETRRNNPYLKDRVDGWLELELGEFYSDGGMEKELEMSLIETKSLKPKHGLMVQGIEIRPKATMLQYI